ncbi:MAG: bifunctional demethylmenaquinone methyltransferase/2-methoxy-6-polyprenyl-1,4-benzoquinol methylase UbiE [Phycisphaeraceae bacterium]
MTTTTEQPEHPAWTDADLAENPHLSADKATRVRQMFSAIAPSYDLNNRVHSMGRDQAWRRAAVKMAELKAGDAVVDVACGTGDLSLAFAHALRGDGRVTGIDFTHEMLVVAEKKQHPRQPIAYAQGDAMNLPLPDACCDVVSIAFGIRNVAEPASAIAEFYRVLRPGGRLIVLEFAPIKNPLLLAGYNVYFNHIMPRTATLISGDKSGAYKYLPKSVDTFIDRAGMLALMTDAGFEDTAFKSLTFGIAICYRGQKKV